MHQAWQKLTVTQRRTFAVNLISLCGSQLEALTADKWQRAEAILRTLLLWRPEYDKNQT